MKKVLIALFFLTGLSGMAATPHEDVEVLSVEREVFYFKVDKAWIGADLEVIRWDGELMGSQTLLKRRALIDFYFLDPGEYVIVLRKGDREKEFQYVRSNPL